MKKIEQFQITSMNISGFKSYEGPTELVFGNPTVITGGNGRGKTSIADAIAFVVTGLPFFGERGIDRLHNENNPDVAIRMCFMDETGTHHELTRTRRKNRMTITYDGYEIRQLDLTDMFGERDVFLSMLDHLVLLDKHGENLLERGLSEERIQENGYRSMPETERGRRLLADLLRSHGHELCGLPGFRTYYGDWTISGPNGFLIPVRNKDGLIQGLKIRLDDADTPDRKYRWFSSRNMPNGTRSYSWVHVTGDTSRKRAFLTEGPLKGDVASHLANNELFICVGGVNALGGLTDTIRELGVREIVEAMDMDQMTNKNVRDAILTMRKEVKKIPGIRYSKYTWNPDYKGVDDYLLSRVAAM